MKQRSLIYVSIEGSSQGPFKGDDSRAGDDGTLVRAFRFGIEVPQGTRTTTKGTGASLAQNKILWIFTEWNALVAQCMQAAWSNNEPLNTVTLTFKGSDTGGKEQTVATTTLKNATITRLEMGMNDIADIRSILPDAAEDDLLAGASQGLAAVGFSAEEIEFDIGGAKATYKRKPPGS